MRKIKILTTILLASTFVMSSCKDNPAPTPEGEIKSVSVIGSQTEASIGYTFSISANVSSTGTISKDVVWSTTNAEVAKLSATSGTQIDVSCEKIGEATIKATSVADNTKFAEFTLNVIGWKSEFITLMNDTLGEEVPFFTGNYTWSSDRFAEEFLIEAKSTDENACLTAVNYLKEAGYEAISEGEDVTYFDLPSKKSIPDGDCFLELKFYQKDEISYCEAYIAESITRWPSERINAVLNGYTKGTPETVPAYEANAYVFYEDKEYMYSCSILAYGGDFNSYLYDLEINLGWFIYDYGSYFAAYSPRNSIEIECGEVSTGAYLFVITANDENMLPLLNEWPASKIAEASIDKVITSLPSASGSNFTFYGGSNYFAQVGVYGGNLENYLKTLQSNGFVVSLDQSTGIYQARCNDLLVEIYSYSTHYLICLTEAPFTVWPTEKIASILQGKTKETVPAASGDEFRLIRGGETDLYALSIVVSNSSLSEYLTTLESNGFETLYVATDERYNAKKGKLFIDLYKDPDNDNGFAICIYFGQPFPTEDINKALQIISEGTTTEVPEFDAEQYRFFDYTFMGGYAYVEGFNYSENILFNYINILEDADWIVTDNTTSYLAVSPAEDISLNFYIDDPAFVVEIKGYVKPDDTWPTTKIEKAVELMKADGYVPEYSEGAKGFVVYNPEDGYPGQISVLVDVGEEQDYIDGFISNLETLSFFVAYVEYYGLTEFAYYAEEGKTLAMTLYSQEDGVVTIELKTLDEPAKRPEPPHWMTDEIAAYVKDELKAKGTVLEYDGEITAFNFPSTDILERPTIMVGVGKGNEANALAKYEQDLLDNDYFAVEDWVDYKLYAQDGDTLRIIPKIDTLDHPGYLLIEIDKNDEPAHKNFPWPTDEIAALVSKMGAVGSAVPEYDGERSNIVVSEEHSFGDYYYVSLYLTDAASAKESYIETLTNLGYFITGDNYGDPIYAKEGETLGISPYTSGDDVLLIELIKLDAPASK